MDLMKWNMVTAAIESRPRHAVKSSTALPDADNLSFEELKNFSRNSRSEAELLQEFTVRSLEESGKPYCVVISQFGRNTAICQLGIFRKED